MSRRWTRKYFMYPVNVFNKNKGIGIITGSGPEAGIDLWQKIIVSTRQHFGENFRGDIDIPNIIIYSDASLGLSMELEKHKTRIWNNLEKNLIDLTNRVDYFCISCYTLHYFEDHILNLKLKAEFISIISVIVEYIKNMTIETLGILSVRYKYILEWMRSTLDNNHVDYVLAQYPGPNRYIIGGKLCIEGYKLHHTSGYRMSLVYYDKAEVARSSGEFDAIFKQSELNKQVAIREMERMYNKYTNLNGVMCE